MGDKPTVRMTEGRAAVLLNVWEHLQAEMSADKWDAFSPRNGGSPETVTRHLCYFAKVGVLERCAPGIYTRGPLLQAALVLADSSWAPR